MPVDGKHSSEQAVLSELERLSSGAALANSPQLKAMLRYLVTETLAGRADKIKAFNIAVDVFGRNASFDPATDTIVRVQAGRLRQALAKHYAGEIEPGALRIDLPKGSYIPIFLTHGDPAAAAPAKGSTTEALPPADATAARLTHMLDQLRAMGLGSPTRLATTLVLIVAAALLIATMTPARPPAIVKAGAPSFERPDIDTLAIAPIHALADADEDQQFGKALTAEVATALTRTSLVKIRLLTTDLDSAGDDPRDTLKLHNPRWGISGVLHRTADARRANVYLVDMATGDVVWSENYTATKSDTPDGLADRLILDLRPQLYAAAKHAHESDATPSPHALFVLATWFPGAEINSLAWQLERVALARRAIAAAPQSGHAYSVLADKLSLLANLDPQFDTEAIAKEAAEAARQARVLAPNSADVAFNLALYHFHLGELTAAARAVERTLDLAPRHTLARFWKNVLPYACSPPPRAVIDELSRFDAALSPSNPVRWQTQAWLARMHLNAGNYREAGEAARRSQQVIPNLGAAIITIVTDIHSGDVASARKVLDEHKAYWKSFSFDHYNRKALARMCAASPTADTILNAHTAAAQALDPTRATPR